MKIPLPEPVAKIYEAVDELTAAFPGRPFTPDGHLVGSIGEVIAAEALGLNLSPPSTAGFDALDSTGRQVQIKLTSTRGISLNATCDRLVVMRIVDTSSAELVFDGDGAQVWELAGATQKNGQRRISFARMRDLPGWIGN